MKNTCSERDNFFKPSNVLFQSGSALTFPSKLPFCYNLLKLHPQMRKTRWNQGEKVTDRVVVATHPQANDQATQLTTTNGHAWVTFGTENIWWPLWTGWRSAEWMKSTRDAATFRSRGNTATATFSKNSVDTVNFSKRSDANDTMTFAAIFF